MGGKLWWITRPTRDLRDLESTIREFADIAQGKKWRGSRDLHKKFEGAISNKTTNIGRDGSGGRTWAAFLRMWGLWYDEQNVKITTAGKVLISGNNIYKQMERLIMNFQITSAYSEHKKLDDGFKIFPFRFVMKLLLDDKIKMLKEDEIAFFVINAKKPSEYKRVINDILNYRKKEKEDKKPLRKRTELVESLMGKYRPNTRTDTSKNINGYLQYTKDIANTIIKNIEYMGEIEQLKPESRIKIVDGKHATVKKLLETYENEFPFSTLYNQSEGAFAEHFGLRYDRKKASKKNSSPNTSNKKLYYKIKNELDKIQKNEIALSMDEILDILYQKTRYKKTDIEKMISENIELKIRKTGKINSKYRKHYIQCAQSGKDNVMFEKMTRDLFIKIGFNTEKHRLTKKTGRGKPEIDGLIRNKNKLKSGILECKSGIKYTFPIGDREKMKNVYIPYFQKYQINDDSYELDFFVYVVGNKVSGLENFEDIVTESKICGTVIYAKELLNMYDKYKSGDVTQNKIWELFKKNKHVTWKDIGDL